VRIAVSEAAAWTGERFFGGHYRIIPNGVHVPDATPEPAPTADAGAPQTVEATSPAGASVTLTGTGTDPDAQDTVTFQWTEGATVLGTAATITIVLPLGAHTLTLTVTDTHGATATATTLVAVQDTTAPALMLPPNQTVDATGAAGAVVSFTASAVDAVSGSVPAVCAPASGSLFPIGTTVVSCAARDGVGNNASGQFTVTIVDSAPPMIAVPADVTLQASNPAGVKFRFNVTAIDLVDGRVLVTCDPPSGTRFPVGVTTVSCWARDRAGNRAVRGFKVTVMARGREPTVGTERSAAQSRRRPERER
jgi:hypothetical protein